MYIIFGDIDNCFGVRQGPISASQGVNAPTIGLSYPCPPHNSVLNQIYKYMPAIYFIQYCCEESFGGLASGSSVPFVDEISIFHAFFSSKLANSFLWPLWDRISAKTIETYCIIYDSCVSMAMDAPWALSLSSIVIEPRRPLLELVAWISLPYRLESFWCWA